MTSCNRYITMTSYRQSPKKEYQKECGYIVKCICNIKKTDSIQNILVTIFTPKTWGDIYYDYLEGLPCNDSVTVKAVTLSFSNFTDTLTLIRFDTKNNFYFTVPDLKNKVKANKQLEIKLLFLNDSKGKIITLKRHRHTYITGGKGIGGC